MRSQEATHFLPKTTLLKSFEDMTLGVLTKKSEQEAAYDAGQKVVEGTQQNGFAGMLFRIAMQRKDRKKAVSSYVSSNPKVFYNKMIGFRLF